jgi:type III secretion system HrpB1/HrpK family protein
MVFKDLAPKLIELLADVVGAGSDLNAHEDVIAVVRALRRLRPKAWELSMVEVWALLSTRDYVGGRQLLEDLERDSPDSALLKAMLALCLKLQEDSVWASYAEQVRAMTPPDEEALAVVRLAEKHGTPIGYAAAA